MKDLFQKYPMKEGETMGSWQHRVTQQIYEEKYIHKTLDEMKEILEQYKKEHPEEFGGKHARLVSPEYSAIFWRLDEAREGNETTLKSIFKRMSKKNKETDRDPAKILDDPRINAYRREIYVNILAPSYKFILSARQEGNEAFLDDVRNAISKNLGKRGPGRCYVRNGFYSVEVYDTPEVRNALESVFEKHGIDTSLLKQKETQNSKETRGIKKQPNPSVGPQFPRVVGVVDTIVDTTSTAKPISYFNEEIKKFNLSENGLASEPLPKHIEKTADGKLKIGQDFGWRAQYAIRTLFEYAQELGISATKQADKEKTPESYRLLLDDTPANRAFINACVKQEANVFDWMQHSPREIFRRLQRSAPDSVVSHLKKNESLINQTLPANVLAAKDIDGENSLFIGSGFGDKAQAVVRALYERGREIGLYMDKRCDDNRTSSSYRLILADNPVNRAFVNANIAPDGKSLVPQEKAMARMMNKTSVTDRSNVAQTTQVSLADFKSKVVGALSGKDTNKNVQPVNSSQQVAIDLLKVIQGKRNR